MRNWGRVAVGVLVGIVLEQAVAGQSNVDLARISKIPAVSGHEAALGNAVRELWKEFGPKTDNLGNVWVTFGSGAPHRTIVAAMDEPGYVVSGITNDGFLRVQRLPQAAPNPSFDALHFAQPIFIMTRTGKQVPGVFAGLSVHLEPGRLNVPKMNHLEEMYVDIGARNADEVRGAGVDLLDAVALNKERIGYKFSDVEWHAAGNGGRFGVMALLTLPREINVKRLRGTLTLAFASQQFTGGRGLDRLLEELHPDEMIYLDSVAAKQSGETTRRTDALKPGTGVLVGDADDSNRMGATLVGELRVLSEKNRIAHTVLHVDPPRIAGYAKPNPFPARLAVLSVPTLWPGTPAETVDPSDIAGLRDLLKAYIDPNSVEKASFIEHVWPRSPDRGSATTLQALAETYGPSGREGAVRDKVKELLPEWARKRVETDAAGNLALRVGDGKRDAKTPRIAFVAHMDEIGYEVKKIEDDGRLKVDSVGGGYPQYFLGHVVLIQKADGSKVGGVLELPEGWDKPGFEWPLSLRGMDEGQHVYVGTKSKEETEKLGIKQGDWMTIPKAYRPLLGTRANARSFDDRVGCAALIEAVRALGPNPDAALAGRDVTFVWSTEEEVGLKGAAAFAEQAAKDGRVPDFVFAIDTFVSSDSPLEVKRFGDAELGKGFVVRAVDNSNVVPLEYVDRVVKLARENKIPVQYGVTGGGNDGAVFTRYGSVDVALGWPLRYSHSPGEVIDTKDADALSKIVEVIARSW